MLTMQSEGQFWVIRDGETEVRRVRDEGRAQAVLARLKGDAAPNEQPVSLKPGAPTGTRAAAPDLSILDSSIPDLRKALATGDHDQHLADILKAERAGKTRKGAVDAIEARQAEIE